MVSPQTKPRKIVSVREKRKKHSGKIGFPEVGHSGEFILRSASCRTDNSITGKIVNQGSVSLGMLYEAFRSRRYIAEFEPELIVGTVPSIPTAFVAFLLSRVYKRPYVIDLRDAWPDLLDQSDEWNSGLGKRSLKEFLFRKGPLQIMRILVRKLLDFVLERSDGIIVTSRHLESQLTERFSPNSKAVTTIRNVFPTNSDPKAKSPRLGECAEFRVLYAGTLGRAQHLINTLEAVRIAKMKGLNVRLRFVGAGPAKAFLKEIAEKEGLPVEFISQHPSDELADFYDWADTALVHLTNWEPLTRTVPSKTYELMEVGKHISAVVAGEAAELIRDLGAGHVVSPEDPEALAQMWIELDKDRSLLNVGDAGASWVRREREIVAPSRMKRFLERINAENS